MTRHDQQTRGHVMLDHVSKHIALLAWARKQIDDISCAHLTALGARAKHAFRSGRGRLPGGKIEIARAPAFSSRYYLFEYY